MEKRFWPAMAAFAALGTLAALTLTGPVRGATLVLLAGFAVKTWIALLRHRQEQAEQSDAGARGHEDAPSRGMD